MNRQDQPLTGREILDEARLALKPKDVVNVEEETIKVVIFNLGDRLYAFYGQDIKEILPKSEIYPVPSLPAYLPGLINIRGDIESVIDLARLLGTQPSPHAGKAMIAMAQRGRFRSGILIGKVEDVVDVAKSQIKPPLATLSGPARELAAGAVELGGGQTATLLDIEHLAAKVTL